MTTQTIFTLTKEDCEVLEKASSIMQKIDAHLTDGSYWTPHDPMAVSYYAKGKAIPNWFLNAMSNPERKKHFTLVSPQKEGE